MPPVAAHLVCAEENALLAELRSNGEQMRYDPELRVSNARRASLGAFASQMLKYGPGRGQVIARQPRGVRPAYLAPSLLLLYLALMLLLLGVGVPMVAATAPASLYAILVLGTAA